MSVKIHFANMLREPRGKFALPSGKAGYLYRSWCGMREISKADVSLKTIAFVSDNLHEVTCLSCLRHIIRSAEKRRRVLTAGKTKDTDAGNSNLDLTGK